MLPGRTLTDVELADSVKLTLGTTSETADFEVKPPPVAVTVSGYVPAVTVEPVVKLSVVLPLALRVAGEKAAVMPVGKPVTENDTAELRALCDAKIVSDPELLAGTVSEDTLAAMESEGTETVNETVAVCLSEPLAPVMVSG